MVPKTKAVADIKSKTLLVQLIEPNSKTERKLRKEKGALDLYYDYVKIRNEVLKKSMEAYWTLNSDILFLSEAEIESKLRTGKDKYVVYWEEWDFNRRESAKVIYEIEGYILKIREGGSKHPFFEVTMPSEILNEADYKFALHQFDKFINAGIKGLKRKDKSLYDKEKSLQVVSEKTLVISEDWLKISEEQAHELYEYDLLITDNLNIDRIVMNGDKDKLYLTNVWSDAKKLYLIAVVDAENQDIVNLYSVGGFMLDALVPTNFTFNDGNISDINAERPAVSLFSFRSKFVLGKKDLKNITSKMAIKMNY